MNETSDELEALWPEALAREELLARVVETSHALHRAVIALDGKSVISNSPAQRGDRGKAILLCPGGGMTRAE